MLPYGCETCQSNLGGTIQHLARLPGSSSSQATVFWEWGKLNILGHDQPERSQSFVAKEDSDEGWRNITHFQG